MSELFHRAVRLAGRGVFRIASRPLILHAERAARTGAYLLVANHASPFDAALLIAATPRVIRWLSIREIFRHPLAGWFLRSILALPLDRSRVDTMTMRRVTRALAAGRIVGMFPEGGVRHGADSVLRGGRIKDGIAKLAELGDVPVLPCVVIGGARFRRWTSWLPLARTRWAVAYGEPLFLNRETDRATARAALAAAIERSLRALHEEVVTMDDAAA